MAKISTKQLPTKTKGRKKLKSPIPVAEPQVKGYEYKIEKGVKITMMRNSNLINKFPFSIMNVGDSFLIPSTDPVSKNPNTVHYAAKQHAKMQPGFMITSRQQLNKDRRVWRIK